MNYDAVLIEGVTYFFEPYNENGLTLRRVYEPEWVFSAEDGGVRCYYIRYDGEHVYLTGFKEVCGRKIYFDPTSFLMLTEPRVINDKHYTVVPFEYDGFIFYEFIEVLP